MVEDVTAKELEVAQHLVTVPLYDALQDGVYAIEE
jgi:hypothetical protein